MNIRIPASIVKKLISWNRTSPTSGPIDVLTWESKTQEAQTYKYHKTGIWAITEGIKEIEWWINKKRIDEVTNPELKNYNYFYGVSQGSPLSPLLSTLPLNYLLLNSQHYDCIQYADDGILYNIQANLKLSFPPETNIKLHSSKSQVIRLGGKWLASLKFLGKTFIPHSFIPDHIDLSQDNMMFEGIIITSTRTPKTFVLHKLKMIKDSVTFDKVMKDLNIKRYEPSLQKEIANHVVYEPNLGGPSFSPFVAIKKDRMV